MQLVPPCPALARWWQTWTSGPLFSWQLWLGVYSVRFFFFLLAMLPSEIPKLPTDPPMRGFSTIWKRLHDSLPRMSLWSLTLLSLFLSFIFCPTSFWREWAAFLGAWCPPPAFKSCFVEVAQHSNDLLMNLWERKWSPHPIPPPSRDWPPYLYFYWSTIDLKCCISFRYTAKWFSYIYVYMYIFSYIKVCVCVYIYIYISLFRFLFLIDYY